MAEIIPDGYAQTLNCKPSTYQERVAVEKDELDAKIEALQRFLAGPSFETVDSLEKLRLQDQWRVMLAYSRILGERIAHF